MAVLPIKLMARSYTILAPTFVPLHFFIETFNNLYTENGACRI